MYWRCSIIIPWSSITDDEKSIVWWWQVIADEDYNGLLIYNNSFVIESTYEICRIAKVSSTQFSLLQNEPFSFEGNLKIYLYINRLGQLQVAETLLSNFEISCNTLDACRWNFKIWRTSNFWYCSRTRPVSNSWYQESFFWEYSGSIKYVRVDTSKEIEEIEECLQNW